MRYDAECKEENEKMLEQRMYTEYIEESGAIQDNYCRNRDLEQISVTHFYSGPIFKPLPTNSFKSFGSSPLKSGASKPLNPIGSQGSGFLKGSFGNIYKEIKLPDFILQERIDAKDPENVHINYDIKGIPGIISRKFLKDFHKIDL